MVEATGAYGLLEHAAYLLLTFVQKQTFKYKSSTPYGSVEASHKVNIGS